ncbi:MAG: nucleotide exchange factor GrpE [Betaproteobacteria bacterium RBG_16_66_20]|nr:MAG: nucleotide exchange factor GrpE [Betaproteobacteria bacterium RBG_16_66_20]
MDRGARENSRNSSLKSPGQPPFPSSCMSDTPAPQHDTVPASAEDKTLDKLLAEAQARIDEQRDAWMRALAEAENVRKRAQADVAAAHKFAIERFAESLLPVMDSLEAALGAAAGSPQALRDGVELTLRQLKAAFQKANLAEIIPVAGERFDPHRHQAMAAVESENAEPNSIVSVMQKGYSLHDRIIRPTLVTVAKALENKGGDPISDANLNSN